MSELLQAFHDSALGEFTRTHAWVFTTGLVIHFVAMSLETGTVAVETTTGLLPGTYCDVLSGGVGEGACTGRTVVVGADRAVRLDLEFGEAVALHADAHL